MQSQHGKGQDIVVSLAKQDPSGYIWRYSALMRSRTEAVPCQKVVCLPYTSGMRYALIFSRQAAGILQRQARDPQMLRELQSPTSLNLV